MEIIQLWHRIIAGSEDDGLVFKIQEEISISEYNMHRYKKWMKCSGLEACNSPNVPNAWICAEGMADSSNWLSPITASVLLSTIANAGACLPICCFFISSFILSLFFTPLCEFIKRCQQFGCKPSFESLPACSPFSPIFSLSRKLSFSPHRRDLQAGGLYVGRW